MSNSHELSAFFMGGQNRLIQCAEIFLQKGHHLLGIISDDPMIGDWARAHSLPLIKPNDDFLAVLTRQPFDLFFSIFNYHKIPKEVLTLPRQYAVNFHDSALPAYAGVHATSWAIINREQIHGVTWHVMTEDVDAGPILKQLKFPVSEQDTAMSLNAKCYEKSLETFSELVDEIADGRAHPVPQELGGRSYFGRWKRPSAACVVDWSRSAEEIDGLFRGLDFGAYPNPFGLPKIFLGQQAVVAKSIRVLGPKPGIKPGTITEITEKAIHVATVSAEVSVGELTSWKGERLSPSSVLTGSGYRAGDVLPRLEAGEAEKITQIHSKLCRHEDYWTDRLLQLEPIEIPYAKRPYSRTAKDQPLEARFSPPEQWFRAREASETPGDVLLTALIAYLYRIGGKEIFDLDYSEACLREQLPSTEGLFTRHAPLRIEVDARMALNDLHKHVHEQIQMLRVLGGTYARDIALRYPCLREALKQDLGRPLQVAVERVRSISDDIAKSDGGLKVVIPDDAKECLWLYDPELLDEKAIDRMQGQFSVLLNDVGRGRDCRVSQLSVLPDTEREMLVSEWSGKGLEYPQNAALHEKFEAQVKRTPDAIALELGSSRLTYAQLNRRANRLAYRLRELGVRPDTLVGLYIERSMELVIAILGILKAGGAYVPLDPIYPQERLRYMLEDARLSVVVTQERSAGKLPASSAEVVCLEPVLAGSENDDSRDDENPVSGAKPENLIYVIYTSGSSGKPKGALVTHANVGRLFDATYSWFKFGPQDIWTLFHSYAFDFSVWEMWGAFLYGGRLVIIPYEVSRSPKDFHRLLVGQKVTVLNQTPSAFYQLIQAEEAGDASGELTLRLVIFGGEALELRYLKPWYERHGDKVPRLVNMYGITETTVHVTYRPLALEDVRSGQGSVIGEALPDLRLYVLDGELSPVPVGVAGEIYVGGAGLGRGYLNREDLTAERFIPDPFRADPLARLYKTGDVGRFLPGQDLEYLGRADQQVQIRGFRVELGEIESVLAEHESIGQVVVVIREDRADDKRLVAYCVASPGHILNIPELRAHLRSKLPEYMIPQSFTELETMPLTPHGKVDRRALPEPKADRRFEEGYVAPRSEVESSIAAIWQDLLKIQNVGIYDNFFELGGHSLLLVQMVDRLQKTFGKELSIVDMFSHPNISALGSLLTQKEKKEPSLDKAFDLAQKQRDSLKTKKRTAAIRRGSHG